MNNTETRIDQKNTLGVTFFIIIGLFLFGFIGENKLFSQPEVCYPDCDTSIWNPNPPLPAYTYVLTLSCGQPVTVYFRIRKGCNVYSDLFIEKVQFSNSAGADSCGKTMSIADMITNIMEQMLVQNPMGFDPSSGAGPDTCVVNYRILLSACWLSTFPTRGQQLRPIQIDSTNSENDTSNNSVTNNKNIRPLYPEEWLQPCSSIQCCLQAYSVCRINGQRVITYEPAQSLPGICYPNEPGPCQPVCE